MGHVGARVADPGEHGDLAGVVQLGQRGGRRMPAQALVLGERGAGRDRDRDRDRGPKLLVQRVAGRREHRQPVDPAGQEHRHQHRARRALQADGLGDSIFEHAPGEAHAPGSVHRHQTARRAEQEPPPVEARAGRHRHPRIPFARRAQAFPGEPAAERLRAREPLAAAVAFGPHQHVCHSGVVGISARSAFWRRIRYVTRSQSAVMPR